MSVGIVVSVGTVVSTGIVVSTGGATVVVTNTQLTSGNCTPDDGDRIANAICELIEAEFPGIQTELWMECHCSSSTTGPNEDTVQSIDEWIELNWTAAL